MTSTLRPQKQYQNSFSHKEHTHKLCSQYVKRYSSYGPDMAFILIILVTFDLDLVIPQFNSRLCNAANIYIHKCLKSISVTVGYLDARQSFSIFSNSDLDFDPVTPKAIQELLYLQGTCTQSLSSICQMVLKLSCGHGFSYNHPGDLCP